MSHNRDHIIIDFLTRPVSRRLPAVKRWHVGLALAVPLVWLLL